MYLLRRGSYLLYLSTNISYAVILSNSGIYKDLFYNFTQKNWLMHWILCLRITLTLISSSRSLLFLLWIVVIIPAKILFHIYSLTKHIGKVFISPYHLVRHFSVCQLQSFNKYFFPNSIFPSIIFNIFIPDLFSGEGDSSGKNKYLC